MIKVSVPQYLGAPFVPQVLLPENSFQVRLLQAGDVVVAGDHGYQGYEECIGGGAGQSYAYDQHEPTEKLRVPAQLINTR